MRIRLGTMRKRFTLVPITASSAGRRVADAVIDTKGTMRPPTPMERMNGSGISTSSASPIATVRPEKIVARPAVTMVRSRAPCGSSVRASSSR
jgi:hypothetical protein